MKNILNRLGIVLHWGLFLIWPLILWHDQVYGPPEGFLLILAKEWPFLAATYTAPAIIFYVLKGRLILFPWNHRQCGI